MNHTARVQIHCTGWVSFADLPPETQADWMPPKAEVKSSWFLSPAEQITAAQVDLKLLDC